AASVEVRFDRTAIDKRTGPHLAMLQIELLKQGLKTCALSLSIPLQELLGGLDRFVAEGMKNEWVHKKRVFKTQELVASLDCKLTQSAFELWLSVSRPKAETVTTPIFTSEPDEIVFEPKFEDLEIIDRKLVVTTKWGMQ